MRLINDNHSNDPSGEWKLKMAESNIPSPSKARSLHQPPVQVVEPCPGVWWTARSCGMSPNIWEFLTVRERSLALDIGTFTACRRGAGSWFVRCRYTNWKRLFGNANLHWGKEFYVDVTTSWLISTECSTILLNRPQKCVSFYKVRKLQECTTNCCVILTVKCL